MGFKSYKTIQLWGLKPWFFNFEVADIKGGIINNLIYTLIIGLLTLVISIPLSIKTSVFVIYRLKPAQSKLAQWFFKVIGGLASVIFALFAYIFITKLTTFLFGFKSGFNFISLILMFIIFNSAVLTNLLINVFNKSEFNNKTYAEENNLHESLIIYKIIFRKEKKAIFQSVFIAFVKVVGEASAVAFLMNSNDSLNIFMSASNFVESKTKTVASTITTSFFNYSSQPHVRDYLFSLSITLILFIGLINFIIRKISLIKFTNENEKNLIKILTNKPNHTRKGLIFHYYHLTWEYFSFIVQIGLLIFMFGSILFLGQKSFLDIENKSSLNQTIHSSVNTLISSTIVALIIIPFSYFLSMFFNLFDRKKVIPRVINSLILANVGIPSLVHGLFVYSVFIEFFGLTKTPNNNGSMIAGIIAVSLLLTPSLVKIWNKAFKKREKLLLVAYNNNATQNEILWQYKIKPMLPTVFNIFTLTYILFLAETSSLLLTAGTVNSPTYSLLYSQQTLNTRMMWALNSNDAYKEQMMLQTAHISVLASTLLSTLNFFITPIIEGKCKPKIHVLQY
ncbi:hypothetical protein [Mycoplasma simbae]|uniref:hypothetical protein n=1 Tax=Mycoplasma simbae TaxID=36744 RepID=UPI0004973CC8|nr:hypothetical protein [Mycoplasma simbae]